MKFKRYILIFIGLLLSACKTPQHVEDLMKKSNFLNGTWVSVESDIYYLEKWEHVKDTIKGITVIYSPKDTLYYESHEIFNQNNRIVFCSKIGKYVIQQLSCFKLYKATRRKVIFKNDTQGIEYIVKKGYLILKSWAYNEDGKDIEKFKLYRKGNT